MFDRIWLKWIYIICLTWVKDRISTTSWTRSSNVTDANGFSTKGDERPIVVPPG